MNRRVLNESLNKVISNTFGKWLLASLLYTWASVIWADTQQTIDVYIDQWKDFYPSSAFGEGEESAAWRFEDFSKQRVSDWLALNHKAETSLLSLPGSAPLNDRVDAQVLLRQVRLELELWEQDRPITQQPQWYTGKISEALTYVLVSEKLSPAEKYKAVTTRLAGVDTLCQLGIESLKNSS